MGASRLSDFPDLARGVCMCVCGGGGGDRLSIARMLGGSEFVDPNQMKIDRVYLRVGTSASLRLG